MFQEIIDIGQFLIDKYFDGLIGPLIVAYLAYVLISRKVKQSDLKRELQAFPFAELTVKELSEVADRGDNVCPNLDYMIRSPISSVVDEVKKSKRIIITGRPGIGKTREAREAIRNLDAEASDSIKIFTANLSAKELIGRPQRREILGVKRPVLFIDDIDDFYGASKKHDSNAFALEPFDQRFKEAVDWFNSQNNDTVVIVTADDLSFIPKSAESQAFWSNFREIYVPDIHLAAFPEILSHLETAFNVSLTEDARQLLISESDQTFQGLVESFYKLSQAYTGISLGVSELEGLNLRANWNDVTLRQELSSNALSRCVFETLSALYRLKIPLHRELVAACVSRQLSLFAARSKGAILKTINNDLRKWIHESEQGIILCPAVYLKEAVSVDSVAKCLPYIISKIPDKFQHQTLWQSGNVYKVLRNDFDEPVQASRFIRRMAKRYPKDITVLNALQMSCIIEADNRRLIRASKSLASLNRNPVTLHYLSCAYGKYAQSLSRWRKSGLHRKAIRSANQAIALDSNYVPAYVSLQINHAELGEHQIALDYVKKATELRGSSRDWYRLAVAYGKNALYDERKELYSLAIDAAKKAISLDGEFLEARESLAMNLGYDGRKEEEAKELEALAEASGEESHWLQMCAVNAKISNFGKVEYAARKLLSLNSTNKTYRDYLFQALYRQDKYSEAEKYGNLEGLQASKFSVAVDRAKERGEAHTLQLVRGQLLASSSDYERWNVLGVTIRKYVDSEEAKHLCREAKVKLLREAVNAHDKALSIIPANIAIRQRAAIYYAKARAYKSLGEYNDSHLACLDALDVDSSYQKPKKLIKELEALNPNKLPE